MTDHRGDGASRAIRKGDGRRGRDDRNGPGVGALGARSTPGSNDCAWLQAQLEALYVHDARGRITTRRGATASGAPHFHLSRSRHGNIWRIRADVPGELARRLSRLAAREAPLPAGPAPWSPPERAGAIRAALADAGLDSGIWSGPVFRVPIGLDAPGASIDEAHESESIDPDDPARHAELCAAFPKLRDAWTQRLPVVVAREHGRIASVCYTAAGDPSRLAEAGVDTRPTMRQRGHAARAVSGWISIVCAMGGTPSYGTSWSNVASLGVARRVGLVPFAETFRSFTDEDRTDDDTQPSGP